MVKWPKQRAWGWYATLIRTPWFCLKLLRFKPDGKLSMQKHKHRTEIWWIIKGYGWFHKYDESCDDHHQFHTGAGYKWIIKPNIWHQYTVWGNKPTYAIELQYGRKVTETDIERK